MHNLNTQEELLLTLYIVSPFLCIKMEKCYKTKLHLFSLSLSVSLCLCVGVIWGVRVCVLYVIVYHKYFSHLIKHSSEK